MYKSQPFLISAAMLWALVTLIFFVLDATVNYRPPIAEDALGSLLSAYLPVLALCVFLLLYLTRTRSPTEWASDFHVNIERARPELWLVCAYLLITQIGLGFFWNTGLHFPGPEVYERNTHHWHDVVRWMLLNSVFYIVIPIYWLRRTGLRAADLLRSLEWRRNAWIIVAYWALDFFGPIISGVNFFSLSGQQYAVGVPTSIAANTIGAGLPVVLLMHVILIPRLMVLFDCKLTVIILAGFFYAVFSLFDPGVDYSSAEAGVLSVTYIIMTQVLVGMGKATFTVVTGNPLIHFITLHVLSARIPFDTEMYANVVAGFQ
ncbi:hypothetical protein OAO91_01065 [Luminiphilus sp.]|nr:hypothetical protein [Luminiphilus sp.]